MSKRGRAKTSSRCKNTAGCGRPIFSRSGTARGVGCADGMRGELFAHFAEESGKTAVDTGPQRTHPHSRVLNSFHIGGRTDRRRHCRRRDGSWDTARRLAVEDRRIRPEPKRRQPDGPDDEPARHVGSVGANVRLFRHWRRAILVRCTAVARHDACSRSSSGGTGRRTNSRNTCSSSMATLMPTRSKICISHAPRS
jgi:hypothetical protein